MNGGGGGGRGGGGGGGVKDMKLCRSLKELFSSKLAAGHAARKVNFQKLINS